MDVFQLMDRIKGIAGFDAEDMEERPVSDEYTLSVFLPYGIYMYMYMYVHVDGEGQSCQSVCLQLAWSMFVLVHIQWCCYSSIPHLSRTASKSC